MAWVADVCKSADDLERNDIEPTALKPSVTLKHLLSVFEEVRVFRLIHPWCSPFLETGLLYTIVCPGTSQRTYRCVLRWSVTLINPCNVQHLLHTLQAVPLVLEYHSQQHESGEERRHKHQQPKTCLNKIPTGELCPYKLAFMTAPAVTHGPSGFAFSKAYTAPAFPNTLTRCLHPTLSTSSQIGYSLLCETQSFSQQQAIKTTVVAQQGSTATPMQPDQLRKWAQ